MPCTMRMQYSRLPINGQCMCYRLRSKSQSVSNLMKVEARWDVALYLLTNFSLFLWPLPKLFLPLNQLKLLSHCKLEPMQFTFPIHLAFKIKKKRKRKARKEENLGKNGKGFICAHIGNNLPLRVTILCAEMADVSSSCNSSCKQRACKQCTSRVGTSCMPVCNVVGRAALAGKSLPTSSSLHES